MPHYCSVKKCSNSREKGCTLFSLPSGKQNLLRRSKWLQNIGRPMDYRKRNLGICCTHFCPDDMIVGFKYSTRKDLRLHADAVPHLIHGSDLGCNVKRVHAEASSQAEVAPLISDSDAGDGTDSVNLVENCPEMLSSTSIADEPPMIKMEEGSPPQIDFERPIFKSIKTSVAGSRTLMEACRICFRSVVDSDAIKLYENTEGMNVEEIPEIKNMLNVVLPSLELDVYSNPVICGKCKDLLSYSFELIQSFQATEKKIKGLLEVSRDVLKSDVDLVIVSEESDDANRAIQEQSHEVAANHHRMKQCAGIKRVKVLIDRVSVPPLKLNRPMKMFRCGVCYQNFHQLFELNRHSRECRGITIKNKTNVIQKQ